MTDEQQPEDSERSTVDVTIDPEDMLAIRDELRGQLIGQYHQLLIAARANRKVGNSELAREQEEQARRTVVMIWCLDNPMAGLTPQKKG